MALGEQDLSYVRTLVYDASAIVIEPGKEYLVEARLDPLAREAGFASLGQLVTHLRGTVRNGLHARVVEAMTTNETTFFRDVHPFELLKAEVLPRLLEARKASKRVTIWCGASSTGQEPYTIAMLLREHFSGLADWRISIVATDLSTAVLERAKAGVYSHLEVNRGLPAPLLVKYFEKAGASFRLKPEITRMVEFRSLNLTASWPSLGPVDIVFLRNVLIYFDVPTKKKILGRVHDLLPQDGVLFLGGAETTLNLDDRFRRIETKTGRGGAYTKTDGGPLKGPPGRSF